ncbi:MAG: hypothetical protein WBG92_09360 [Thiohalocapsa sp.]
MNFIHRFGFSLNRHNHDHKCIIDGMFDAAPMTAGPQFTTPAALKPDAAVDPHDYLAYPDSGNLGQIS